jgi:DNA-directed RNA polymerase subunit RPC12/RpoP
MEKYNCDTCDAEFKIKYDLDEAFFYVNFCPFCGHEIDDTDEEEVEDYEMEDED